MKRQMVITLIPAIYSRAQTAEEVVRHITAYPTQDTNCKEAYEHSIEFTTEGDEHCTGTLSEFRQSVAWFDKALIYPRKGGGIVEIDAKDGIFTVVAVKPAIHRPGIIAA